MCKGVHYKTYLFVLGLCHLNLSLLEKMVHRIYEMTEQVKRRHLRPPLNLACTIRKLFNFAIITAAAIIAKYLDSQTFQSSLKYDCAKLRAEVG